MSIRRIAFVLAIAWLAAGCAPRSGSVAPALARVTLAPAGYQELPGWSEDDAAAAVPAFVKSCARLAPQPDSAPLDPAADSQFGRVEDWRPLCELAAKLPAGDAAAARRFFEANFVPALVASKGASRGLFTGYWEVELNGSLQRKGAYRTPVYRKPADLGDAPYLDRAAIEDGALNGKSLELVWLESPDDLFVLQMQGSGRIHLAGGRTIRVVYAANNKRPFVNIYQLLAESGAIPPAQLSEGAVRAWMRDNPEKARELRRKDPLYVFFRELQGDGPVGYQGAVLTPERSLAVDHRYIPLGAPLWLAAHDKYRPVAVNRLVVAQDIGDGITGPLRGDLYWGSGSGAVARGANFYADGQYWVLLPKSVATKTIAALK